MVDATTGTPDEGLHASFEPRRDRAPTGWRFVQRPTRPASGRHFKSQPIETRGRYEQTLNARPNLPSGTSGAWFDALTPTSRRACRKPLDEPSVGGLGAPAAGRSERDHTPIAALTLDLMSAEEGGAAPIPWATVVVDANVVIRSPRLNSGAWRAALHAYDSGSLVLRVPEVALQEAVAWFARELPGRMQRYRRAASQLAQFGVRLEEHGAVDTARLEQLASEVQTQYDSYLRGRFGDAAVLPIPEVDHRTLVHRAVRRMKPFSESGSGYRDALIWESVCALAASEPVFFVSDNSKDFADDDGRLAAVLQADLEDRGIAPCSVTLSSNLLDIVTQHAPEAVDARAVVERLMRGDAARRQLEWEFAHSFAADEEIPLPLGSIDLHPLMFDAAVEAAGDLDRVEVQSVKPTGDATYLVVGTASATGRAYSVRERVDISDVDAAHAAVASGRVDEAFQRGEDLVLIKYLPVTLEFEANLDPGDVIWNAGVVAVWPSPTAERP